jgi:hypothetical protein
VISASLSTDRRSGQPFTHDGDPVMSRFRWPAALLLLRRMQFVPRIVNTRNGYNFLIVEDAIRILHDLTDMNVLEMSRVLGSIETGSSTAAFYGMEIAFDVGSPLQSRMLPLAGKIKAVPRRRERELDLACHSN